MSNSEQRRRERQAIANYPYYCRSNATTLYHVYGSFSPAKQNAWYYCRNLMYKKGGSDLKVISHNSWMFTAGFEFEEAGKQMFMYITPTYDVAVEVEEDE